MTELDETKFWVALTRLETIVVDLGESQKRTDEKLSELIASQLHGDRKLTDLVNVVRDLATIVASHERRLADLEGQ